MPTEDTCCIPKIQQVSETSLATGRIISNMTMTWIGRARARMAELGLNQNDLIEPLGVQTRGAVGHYMTGRREPSMSQMIALSTALRMSLDDLLLGKQRENYVEKPANQSDDQTGEAATIPLLGITTISPDGMAATTEDFTDPVGWIDFKTSNKHTFALEIRGGAVRSALRPGWFLVVESNTKVIPGDTVLVLIDYKKDSVQELLWITDEGITVASLVSGERSTITEPIIDLFRIAAILPPSTPRRKKS